MQYVESMTSILSDHLGWYLARLKFIARYTAALLKLATTNLQGLAVALKADAKEASDYRRIRRFLSDYEVDFAARPPSGTASAADATLQGCARPHGVAFWPDAGERSHGRNCPPGNRLPH